MPALDLTLPPRLGSGPAGRKSKEIVAVYERDATEQDIAVLVSTPLGAKSRPLQSLRAIHHSMAILLSQGKGPTEVARICGYSVGRIQSMKQDPAFRQLVSHYTKMGELALADVYSQLKDLGQGAIAALNERLESDPDSISSKDLTRLVEVTADRTGHGPTKTVKTIDSKAVLQELIERKEKERKGKLIEPEISL